MRGLVSSTILVLGMAGWVWASAQAPAAKPAAPRGAAAAPAQPPAVATVGPLRILRAELDARVQQGLAEYKQRMGNAIPDEFRPIVERQMLENLLRGRLLMLEAERRQLGGTDADAENELRKDPFFLDNGKFSEARFQKAKAADPQRFAAAVRMIKAQLGAMRLSRQLEQQHAPPEAALRARAEHELLRVNLDYLPLTFADYPGTYDEPTERQVLDHFHAHAAEFRRVERVKLTVVFVDHPPLPDSLAQDADAQRTWDRHQRASADSALAALRAGASIDSVGAALGGLRRDVVVAPGSFPGFWAGDERVNAAVFTTAPGSYLPMAVKAVPGWLLARVEEHTPEHAAALVEVARDIRDRLRRDARDHGDEHRLEALYAARRDSLAVPGLMMRYAAFDTARVAIPAPSSADLDRFYRGHLADYSTFDPQKGVVVEKGLATVRGDVAQRWAAERRLETARAAAEAVYRAWSTNRRDAAAERVATTLREVGPIPLGAPPDTGLAAGAIADSLLGHPAEKGAGTGTFERGRFVWQITSIAPRVTPTFEQARPRLTADLASRREAADLAGARALWERDPKRFAGGDVMMVNRLLVPNPQLMDVPLSRAEVERWFHEHMGDYSAGEEVHARHILFTPKDATPAALEAARQRALTVLARIRAGEDFATLARQNTDDVATREAGGDLGNFGRGVMLDAFEKAAFAMKPGEISEPVRTEVGWHVIECLEHLPPDAEPLSHIYINVASDAARVKGERIARSRADSLMNHVHSVADAKAIARRTGLSIIPMRVVLGDPVLVPDEVEYIHTLERMKRGELYPTVHELKGLGYGISWVDTILPAPAPSWDQARDKALLEYRGDAVRRTLAAKRAELDSMLAAGWSFDSLGTLYGGLEHAPEVLRQGTLRGLGRLTPVLDSLCFGTDTTPAVLAAGQLSPWQDFRSGTSRVRVAERLEPLPAQVTARIESARRGAVEGALGDYFEGLKKRFPVRILDARLRDLTPPRSAPAGP